MWKVFCVAIIVTLIVYVIILTIRIRNLENNLKDIIIFREGIVQSLVDNYKKQQKVIHDFRNHLMCIGTFLSNSEYENLQKYVEKIYNNFEKNTPHFNTNNTIVNAIVNSKYTDATNKGIVFVCKFNDLSGIYMEDEEIVVLLANLLDNAIEACNQVDNEKIIRLKIIQERDKLVISVSNSYDGVVMIKDGNYVTKKNDAANHGWGMSNVFDIIYKYKGYYSVKNDEKEFQFSIIFPVE